CARASPRRRTGDGALHRRPHRGRTRRWADHHGGVRGCNSASGLRRPSIRLLNERTRTIARHPSAHRLRTGDAPPFTPSAPAPTRAARKTRPRDAPRALPPRRGGRGRHYRMFITVSTLANPVHRRLAAAVASGTLIALAFLARHAFGVDGAWAPLLTAAALVGGGEIAVRAWNALRVRQLGIELLVTIAAAGALVIGEPWEAAAVTFLFTIGAWLEARTMRRTRGALARLLDSAPEVATVERNGVLLEVAPNAVRPDETVVVRPGQRIPVDGTVREGAAAVDESAISGEPMPAEKTAGSRVWAGTIAQNGLLRIVASGVGADTTLARIVRRVEEAQEQRAPAQRAIERFARWYTPGIVLLAVAALLVTGDVRLALTLLVVGCPGALVIATPVAVVAGIGRAAR